MTAPYLVWYPGLLKKKYFQGWVLAVRGVCAVVLPMHQSQEDEDLFFCDVRTLLRSKP